MGVPAVLLASAFLLPAAALADPVPVECRPGAPTICLAPDADAPNVLVALTLPVGSADEGPEEYGLAHYVEHLTFRNRAVEGGEARPVVEGSEPGAGIDGFGNAYTSTWATTYHWTVPPQRAAEAVARAMAVLDPLDVPQAAAAQERNIVARERAQREDGPAARSALVLDALLYDGGPLARSIGGSAEDIAALGLPAAGAFHARHYDPATAVLVLAGDVDWDAARSLIGSGRPEARRVPPIPSAPAGDPARVREDVVQRSERWHVAVAPLSDKTAPVAALWVLDAYLASSLQGAPHQALLRGRDDLSDAWAEASEVVPGMATLDVGIVLRPGLQPEELAEPWQAWRDLWAGLVRDGLDAPTVERLRARLVRDEARSRANGLDAAWSLIGWLEAGATPQDWAEWPARLDAVTADDVAAVLGALNDPIRSVTLDTLPLGSSSSQDTGQ